MGALSDVRVLDLSRLLPGGFCSLLLADLGADVLKDGGWVALAALEPKFWRAWCLELGARTWSSTARSVGSQAEAEVEEVFAARTRDAWARFAAEHECCLEPVLDLDEVLSSPLVRARGMVVEVEQPGAERPVRQLGTPLKLGRTPAGPPAPAPLLGEHTRNVLSGLGYDGREIAAMEEAGAVAGPGARHARAAPRLPRLAARVLRLKSMGDIDAYSV